MKVLIVEDEQELSKSIVSYLKEQGYLCETAFDFQSAIEKISIYRYDCIVLDINLPGGSGMELLKYLKTNTKPDAVLIISARGSLDDRIGGLQSGADDYLAKPFHLAELSARLAAIIRRRNFNGNTLIEFNEIAIDTVSKTAFVSGQSLDLTKKEFELLLYLIINKKKVIAKNAIAEHLWGDEIDMANNFDFIYTHIKNLRRKLDEKGCHDYIRSIYGMGYKFTD